MKKAVTAMTLIAVAILALVSWGEPSDHTPGEDWLIMGTDT
jgi:hypothetical protein